MQHIIKTNKEIKFTNNIQLIIERQNLAIKLYNNPNKEKYKCLIDEINILNNKNIILIKEVNLTNIFFNFNILNNKLFLLTSHKFNTLSNFIALIIFVTIIYLICKTYTINYNIILNFFLHLFNFGYENIEHFVSHFILVFLIIWILINGKNIIYDWYRYISNKNKIIKIKDNLHELLLLCKKIVYRRLMKDKDIIISIDTILENIRDISFVDFLLFIKSDENKKHLDIIYNYINYIEVYLTFEKYYFPAIGSELVIPPNINYEKLSSNMIIINKKSLVIESIKLFQVYGISMINELTIKPFVNIYNINDFSKISELKLDNENNLIIINNIDLNINMDELLSLTKSENYFIIMV